MDGSYGVGKYSLLVLLYLVTAAGLVWAWAAGMALIGEPGWTRMSVATGAPLLCLWLMFAWTKLAESADNWHFRYVVISSLLILVIAFQPWHPRAIFVRRLYSIEPGMTKQEVEIKMAPYYRYKGSKKTLGNSFVMPEEVWQGRPSGPVYFRWNETHAWYDFDLGEVVFKDGLVVSRRFLGD